MRQILLGLWMTMVFAGSAYAGNCFKSSESTLTVSGWSISPIDDQNNALTVTLKSSLSKPVRMIDGQVGFVDALGKEIARYDIARDANVPADGEFTETTKWGPFTFERLLKLKKEEVAPFACVSAVLYDDGTTERFN